MREVGKTSNGKVLVEMTPEELASVAKLLDLADILWPPLDEEAAVRRVKLYAGSPVIDDLKKRMQARADNRDSAAEDEMVYVWARPASGYSLGAELEFAEPWAKDSTVVAIPKTDPATRYVTYYETKAEAVLAGRYPDDESEGDE